MNTIAVFFSAPGFDDYPFDDKEYRASYHELGAEIEKRGGRLVIVRSMDTYLGHRKFSRASRYENGEFIHENKPVTVDVLWNRGNFHGEEDFPVINDPEFSDICTNKWKTYHLFPALHSKTFLAEDSSQFESALSHLSGTIVAKPLNGERGQGLCIGTADDVRSCVTSYPYLVQEFIDTSNGIEGIAPSLHDFRIISIRGDIVLCYIREPKRGSFIANESYGGTATEVPIDRIPPKAMNVFRTIDGSLKKFKDRVYSVDMGLGKDGRWTVIELNAQPGLDPSKKYAGAKRYIETVAALLLEKASR